MFIVGYEKFLFGYITLRQIIIMIISLGHYLKFVSYTEGVILILFQIYFRLTKNLFLKKFKILNSFSMSFFQIN